MNQENPYSAPEAGLIDQPDKPGKLYSQNQVLAATFFGSLICGALLLKHNFSAKKDELTGNIIFYSSIVLLVLLVATTWNISERANILISTLSVAADMLTAYMIYRYLLNSAFKEHIKKGGGIMSSITTCILTLSPYDLSILQLMFPFFTLVQLAFTFGFIRALVKYQLMDRMAWPFSRFFRTGCTLVLFRYVC